MINVKINMDKYRNILTKDKKVKIKTKAFFGKPYNRIRRI